MILVDKMIATKNSSDKRAHINKLDSDTSILYQDVRL